MKSATQLKGLGDVRTAISTHARSTPRMAGSTFLGVYILDKEKQRLSTEHMVLAKRQGRIQGRLEEIKTTIQGLVARAQQEQIEPAAGVTGASVSTQRGSGESSPGPSRFRKVTVGY